MAKKHDKFKPLPEKEYLVTDQCYWQPLTEEERRNYNPHDKDRAPHFIQLVEKETGTVVNLKSGSVVKVIVAKE